MGLDAERVDLLVDVQPTGDPAAPGDHPFGWRLLAGTAPFKDGDAMRKTFEARTVILGLPQHAGLATTIAARYRHFYYDDGPQLAWVDNGPAGPVYDLRRTFTAAEAALRGQALRKQVEYEAEGSV